jgi:hypothetical protein
MEEPRTRDAGSVDYGELPELTRALRALGSSRSGGNSQVLFFGPLLEARRRAADARTAHARVRAFSSADLTRALDRAIERIVAEWPDARPPARRALRHQLVERVDSYTVALHDLGHLATALLDADDENQLDRWRAWTRQLTTVFEVADRTWLAIRPVVEALPRQEKGLGRRD